MTFFKKITLITFSTIIEIKIIQFKVLLMVFMNLKINFSNINNIIKIIRNSIGM
ncbi:uncharacterized protein ASCRUDRAFT_75302 [Ascoidea rubescens DSM 1968]|uniref:Uncharacterized protein n=1 Tax=Ascoidea rubescens DSM 1968 TaxID=1344418 RepID=A0A1D2VKH3_9ASCO|nr:hypothetical protein ASCRUDRAFT_75302 [Ascoidea rubescens DSM 1968]ODV62095.1 hypothetical protein ASCRUDRAFT_75302 [Ascoidea rubescens DSM 1968]